MTFKKLPGCEPVYMVYDKRDRLVLTQDGNMRASNANKWSYTEYNTKNRPVESGEIVLNASATHAQLIDSMMNSESVPSGTRTPLQYIRYDKYTANEHVTPHAFVTIPGYAEDYHPLTIGLVTATKTRVLGTDQWITSTVYYDSRCRPMQEITDNLVGGVTRVTHSYDFVGNVVKSQESHGTNTLEYAYTYDDRSRLLNVTASLNGATPVTMKTLEYDEVGRMKKVKLHNNTTSSEYDYNIRSWLTGITGSNFMQSLTYGDGNGNIRSMNWNANGSSHSYTFTYDGANRMLDAIHGTGAYTEKVTSYDKNGNILGLQRYGNGLIDDLTYTYNGNQLTKVEDATDNSAGFNNGTSTTNEYTYDYNGNLTKDSNKGIANISWNSLNLPNVVSFSDGSTITYTYAADGTKLRTVHNINGTTTQTDYCGSAIYENGTAKLWQTEAGYISMTDSKYHYYLQDHQGNNRVVVSETGATEEVNHYYAFGGLFGNSNNVQPFKYNGKELDTKKGLNWYDYGARQYDAALGRWFAVDPMAEKRFSNSVYSYTSNNPINKIDPNGMLDDWVEDKDGNIYWDENATSQSTTKEGETYLGKIVVVFEGYMDEELGIKRAGIPGFDGKHFDGYLDGEGAKAAQVTVYGPNGQNDISKYTGFTMTSNYELFGAIANGYYNVIYKIPGKGGALPSNYAINNAQPVNCINGINPSPQEYHPFSSTQKNGVYIHRTNKSGWAGGSVSTGCLLILGTQWEDFTKQIGNNNFKLKLTRK